MEIKINQMVRKMEVKIWVHHLKEVAKVVKTNLEIVRWDLQTVDKCNKILIKEDLHLEGDIEDNRHMK